MTKRSTKHTHRTKDRVTRTPLLTGDELRCFGRVGNSCVTSGTCRVNLVKPDGKSCIRKGPGSVHKPLLYTSTIRIKSSGTRVLCRANRNRHWWNTNRAVDILY